jgi:hypothetical protein
MALDKITANMVDADVATQAELDALVDAAPGALNTLNELAAALNDDASFSTTLTTLIATKATPGKAIAMSLVFG